MMKTHLLLRIRNYILLLHNQWRLLQALQSQQSLQLAKLQIQNKIRIIKMQEHKQIQISGKTISNNKFWILKQAKYGNTDCFAKIMHRKMITEYQLDNAIGYNVQVLDEITNMLYPQHFLKLHYSFCYDDAAILLVQPYNIRLDQFLKIPLKEHDAMEIFQHIIKAVYSLYKYEYWHCNVRAQHFVKVDTTWKMDTIVYERTINQSGIDSQYVYNSEWKPPEEYTNAKFTEEELNQRIVWDLGCLLISLILGGHRLRNLSVLDKFKGQPFSFDSIGAKAGGKTSLKFKQMLGKMCHYNYQERIKFKDLLLSGFFSQQVAKDYKNHVKMEARKKSYIQKTSLSERMGKQEQSEQVPIKSQLNKLLADAKKLEEENVYFDEYKIMSSKNFKKRVQKISDYFQSQPNPEIDSQNDEIFEKLIIVYKNYIDKGEILAIGGSKLKALSNFNQNTDFLNDLLALTDYALKFVQVLELFRLADAMNNNLPFFNFHQSNWELFHGSPDYNAIKYVVNSKKKIQYQQLEKCRARVLYQKRNKLLVQKYNILKFVERCSPEFSSYNDIKQPYRKILKMSYDIVADNFPQNPEACSRMGMYLTFCMAVDKYYLPADFQKNFKYYLEWKGEDCSNYVSLRNFQQYLEEAPWKILVENSRFVMNQYFQ